MKDWLASFPLKKFSIFAVLIVAFVYNVLFEGDVPCTCKDVGSDCVLYLVLPSLIIFALMIWTDETCFKVCRICCSSRCSSCQNDQQQNDQQQNDQQQNDQQQNDQVPRCLFGKPLCSSIFKAFLVSLLWILSVLIDGDWVVCCLNDGSEQQSQLACKEKNNITATEKFIITRLKNTSRYVGFGGVLLVLLLLIFIKVFDKKKCCCNFCNFDRRRIYYKMVLEENEEVLKNELREAAKRDLTEKIQNRIQQDKWEECFEVAEEMIRNGCRPKIVQKTEQQQDRQQVQQLVPPPEQQLDLQQEQQPQQQQQNQQLEQQLDQQREEQLDQQLEQQQLDQQLEQQQDQQHEQQPEQQQQHQQLEEQQDQQHEQQTEQQQHQQLEQQLDQQREEQLDQQLEEQLDQQLEQQPEQQQQHQQLEEQQDQQREEQLDQQLEQQQHQQLRP